MKLHALRSRIKALFAHGRSGFFSASLHRPPPFISPCGDEGTRRTVPFPAVSFLIQPARKFPAFPIVTVLFGPVTCFCSTSSFCQSFSKTLLRVEGSFSSTNDSLRILLPVFANAILLFFFSLAKRLPCGPLGFGPLLTSRSLPDDAGMFPLSRNCDPSVLPHTPPPGERRKLPRFASTLFFH